MKKKICIMTNGCPENRIDGARVAEFLTQNEYSTTNNYQEADVVIFNACKTIGSFDIIDTINNNKKKSAELIVYGCLPKVRGEKLREVYQGIAFGSDDVEKFNQIFKPHRVTAQEIHANYLLPCTSTLDNTSQKGKYSALKLVDIIPKITRKINKRILARKYLRNYRNSINVISPESFFIKISTGCQNNCSFCATKFARGNLKSKNPKNILAEFERGLEQGYKSFGLLGTDIGCYGRDIGTNLAELLESLVQRSGDYQIRIRNINSRFMIQMAPQLAEIFKSGKIPYFESAVQSGNNRILKLMGRRHTIEEFKKAVEIIRSRVPDIQIRTQTIVGFPSETEDEFQDTVRLLDEIDFNYVEVYGFGAFPNTAASKMKDQIPARTISDREYKLLLKAATTCTHRSQYIRG